MHISNKYAALEEEPTSEVQSKQLAVIEEVEEIIQVDNSSPSSRGMQGNDNGKGSAGKSETDKNPQVDLVAAQLNSKRSARGSHDAAHQHSQQVGNMAGKLNPTAPEFSINSGGIGSNDRGVMSKVRGKGHKLPIGKESTVHWVQRIFKANTG